MGQRETSSSGTLRIWHSSERLLRQQSRWLWPLPGRYPDLMLLEGIGIKRRLIPIAIAVAFAVIVSAVGNDVVAAYGGLLVFFAIYGPLVDRARRRRDVPSLSRD